MWFGAVWLGLACFWLELVRVGSGQIESASVLPCCVLFIIESVRFCTARFLLVVFASVWFGLARFCSVRFDWSAVAWFGHFQLCSVRFSAGSVRFRSARFRSALFGSVRFGSVLGRWFQFDTVRFQFDPRLTHSVGRDSFS